jgi:hypothetical protein
MGNELKLDYVEERLINQEHFKIAQNVVQKYYQSKKDLD